MKVSLRWLREWANPSVPDKELMHRLTMAGLEIDGSEPVAGSFSGVVVGEILSVEPHPNADKLRVCQVNGHPEGKALQVVCGAENARAGIKIPFALVGAVLPPKQGEEKAFEIKAAALRGVDSFGMLCGASELGIDLPVEGLMELPADAPTGQDIRQYLQLEDSMIEVNVTPNRGDCLSVRGLAREISTLTTVSISAPDIKPVVATISDQVSVTLEADTHCSRYVGRVIRGIDNSRPSPLWLKEKLRRSGIRSIDAVVDVTNYVLLELGQPMHAFDLSQIQGNIHVRLSQKGEKIKLLNEQEITLATESLLIADDRKPLAMAGIMGGADSAVSASTQNILLEAAYFDPLAMAGKARSHGLHTDSSQRFERGVDGALQEMAIERATTLLLTIVGGAAGPLVVKQAANHRATREPITLRISRVKDYLGLTLNAEELGALLEGLGLQVVEVGSDSLKLLPPSWRFDLSLEVDLLEEVARIYGYNRLPTRSCLAPMNLQPAPETQLDKNHLKQRLASLGYQEVITYSFVDPAMQHSLGLAECQVPVQNPISAEMGVMRTSLFPGLLTMALYNFHRQQERVRAFETGLIFHESGGEIQQQPMLGMLISGSRERESWSRKTSQLVDFYDIKGDIEALFCLGSHSDELDFLSASQSIFHPGQQAIIRLKKREIGAIGMLHPAIQQKLGLVHPVFLAQLRLEALLSAKAPVFEGISRFPEVRRDLAFLVSHETPVQALLDEIQAAADSYLTNLKVFDVYSGEGIDSKRKSVALGLTFRHKSRTLTDSEISENVDRVVAALKTRFQADLRS